MEDPQPATAAIEIPDQLTVNLRKPVSLGEETYDRLELREPTAAEWSQFDKVDGVDGDVLAISIISGVPRAAVAKIGTRDLLVGARYLARFLA